MAKFFSTKIVINNFAGKSGLLPFSKFLISCMKMKKKTQTRLPLQVQKWFVFELLCYNILHSFLCLRGPKMAWQDSACVVPENIHTSSTDGFLL